MTATSQRQRLAAILAADVAGYSRLMAADELATVAALDAARAVFRKHIESQQGRVVDMAGDSVLAVFETATGAVSAALAAQNELRTTAAAVPEDRRMLFRIGVHLGEVIEKPDGTVYGDGVNIAARLQGLAEPGGITVSEAVRGSVKSRVPATFEDRGERQVKNIAGPVRVYAVRAPRAPASLFEPLVDVSSPVPGFGGRPAIAVLPFTNLSGDAEQEYFADGLADDILTRLAGWRWLPVIARNSTFTFKGRAVDVKEVGRAFGARYVLEGSVRKAGTRVRVTAQLIDAETGHHVWAQRYDRVLEDIFAIQDEITESIVNALEPAVGRAEMERAHRKPPSSLSAWELTARGWWHAQRWTREDFAAAVPLFRRASELDPGSSQPLAGIALVRLLEGFFLWTANPAEAFGESLTKARAAIAADALDPLAHAILAYVLAFVGKHDDALAASRRAIDLNPSLAVGHHVIGVANMFGGDPKAGVGAIEAAIRISPNDPMLHVWLGTLSACYYLARDYEKAAEVARLSVQRAPQYPIGQRSLANALGQLGRLEEAREALGNFLALMPNYTTEQAARRSVAFRREEDFQHYIEGLRRAGWTG